MSELPSPKGGPATPVKPPTPPLPGGIIRLEKGVDLTSMTPEQIQAQIVARERDMKYQIQAIKGELTDLVEDVNIGGRPLSDRIREQPLLALGLAAGAGGLLSFTIGMIRRAGRRPAPDDGLDFTRARIATLLDEAAYKVARGTSVEEAMRNTLKTTPAVYMDRDPRAPVPKTRTQQSVGLALNTALGFAVKMGLDHMTKKLTGESEIFEALEES